MTDDKENHTPPSGRSEHRALENRRSDGVGEPSAEIEIRPAISGFFEQPKASASAFFKVIRNHDVKRFTVADQADAEKLMEEMDPDGERLWNLMSQASLPEAVDAWILGAAQKRLATKLGEFFDPQEFDKQEIFKSLTKGLSKDLQTEDKEKRRGAENWLRIGLSWLIEKRTLQPWQIAEGLLPILFPESKSASRLASRAIQKGKASEFRLAIAVAGLAHDMVKVAERERDQERQISAGLRDRLADTRATLDRLQAKLTETQNELAQQNSKLVEAEATLAAERQHWGHDLSETKAEQRVLLGERIGPLLQDAVDALEIDPPAPGLALRRIKAALSTIEEAKA
ncbi:hypothetical protein [Prosthecomicrobium pneumaticum]|uniref:Putative coiled-coil protein SlyX n=1 Tax=Prosthecomicrobium pneumaticum TaxID=81895 RepID=A0A7W9FQ09_9HYPH|nr:hypothetical protein [Prosthecomicrobium pneumaticum]MBB5754666.1 putative coiled-coil protein SlyX [Prosthecomicrobium pneumaticum]